MRIGLILKMAENTPESELGSIECFQNYTAPEVFIQGLAGIVDQQDVESMIRAQKQMLQRFEKTNEMLTNCNALSVNRLKTAGTEFKKHTQLLGEMKKDLDGIFKRIRVLKSKLSSQHPQAFQAALEKSRSIPEDSEEATPGPSNAESLKAQSDLAKMGLDDKDVIEEDDDSEPRYPLKRVNSSSTDSANGNSNNDTSPYTSDTG